MNTTYLGVSIGFMLMVFILPMDALGQTTSDRVDSSIGWQISHFFRDFYIDSIIQSDEKKAELHAEQAQDIQNEIERFALEGKPIPNDYVEKVEEKRSRAEMILLNLEQVPLQGQNGLATALAKITARQPTPDDESANTRINTGVILESLKDVNEANKIRLLVNDFNELRVNTQDGTFDTVTLETRANQIDSRANSLDLIIENCDGRISSLDLAFESSPYSVLQNQCPILQNHSLEDAKERLNLIGSDID